MYYHLRTEHIVFTSAHTLTHQQPPINIIIIIMSDENDEKVLFKPEILSTAKVHSGYLHRIKHYSPCNKCHMTFAIYIPSDEDDFPVGNGGVRKMPLILYLSGLTCDDTNVSQKGNAFETCKQSRICFLMPDTSPRGHEKVDEEESASWDFGLGAGFYVDATTKGYAEHYNMETYATKELEQVCKSIDFINEKVDFNRQSIMGHSMGGHGALTLALRNPAKYRSVSAFAPIANPSAKDCPWGQKAFKGYLKDENEWKMHDATELVKMMEPGTMKTVTKAILIDQGDADTFYKTQLHPERFQEAAEKNTKGFVTYNVREGYDHSYWFISTFMHDHVAFHAIKLLST